MAGPAQTGPVELDMISSEGVNPDKSIGFLIQSKRPIPTIEAVECLESLGGLGLHPGTFKIAGSPPSLTAICYAVSEPQC